MKIENAPVVLPQPNGHWLFGNLQERNEDAIKFFSRCFADHGDFFKVRFLHVPIFVTARPDLAKEVLFDRPNEFVRKRVFDELSQLLGRGLLTTEGDKWRKHRRLAQPAFHMKSINGFFDVMVKATDTMLDGWEQGLNHVASLRDISDDFMKLTLQIVSESLFGFNTNKDSEAIGEAVSFILPQIFYHLEGIPFLKNIPNKKNREFNRRLADLNKIIFAIIEKRRGEKESRHDLLGMLMAAVDDEPVADGESTGLSNTDLRDEVMTMFMAGHETTANGLAWAMHLLADHPEVEAKIRDEVSRVVGDQPLRLEHLRELTYTRMVFEETLRLFPPVWAMPRTAIQKTTLRGVEIPKGAIVSVNPFLLHRNPNSFKDPLKFDPERFSPERRKEFDRYAYIPFGAGPHTCIGNQFALMEAQVILASIYRKYRLERPEGESPVRPLATITLRPEPAIRRRLGRLN